MTIKVRCASCKTTINAKSSLAGQRVKCPKCRQPLIIPKAADAKSASVRQAAAATAASQTHNPLLDLLDEAGVQSMPKGPICPNCASEIQPDAVLCVECGFNLATGERLETTVFDEDEDDYSMEAAGMTDTDKIMAQAEKDIEDLPVTAVGQDFGDGADSIMIAGIAFAVLGVMVAIGIATIFLMDQLTEVVSTPFISFCASLGIYLLCFVWITYVAFRAKPIHGIICICSAGLYCAVFAFLQGKALLLPMIVMLAGLFIGMVSWVFWYYRIGAEEKFGMILDAVRVYLC